jgi:hypothetical protein
MPEFRNSGTAGPALRNSFTDDVVAKAGRAIGQMAQIREAFQARVSTATTEEERQQLSQRADQVAAAAVSKQGLSVEQYSPALAAADADPELGRGLEAAAQEAG